MYASITYPRGLAFLRSCAASIVCVSLGVTAAPLEEVVVTAQKREETIMEAALAVSAYSGNDLDVRGYESIEDFTGAVAGLSISNYAGYTRPNIRGIGQSNLASGAEGSVALHRNGVYLSRPFEGSVAFMDTERVEVVRGPQGTLYGRNATGGSVNIITRRPTEELEARAELTYGNYDRISSEAILSGPIIGSTVLGRIAFHSEDRDGYSKNLFDGKDYDDASSRTLRGTLLIQPTDNVTASIIVDYHHEDDRNYATHYLGNARSDQQLTGVLAGFQTVPRGPDTEPLDPRTLNVDGEPNNEKELFGITGEIVWDISDSLSLKSITAYRQSDLYVDYDLDATPQVWITHDPGSSGFIQTEDVDQVSQELQLIGSTDRLDWILGLYYFEQSLDPGVHDIGLGPASAPFPLFVEGMVGTEAYAIFGQGTYAVTDRLNLTAGLRWSGEQHEVDESWTTSGFPLGGFGPCVDLPGQLCHQVDKEDWDAFTPKVVIDYRLSDDMLTYFSVSRGFKSGGWSMGDLEPPFDPEFVWAYEVGLKFTALDGRVRSRLAAFHYDYTDLQIQKVVDGFLVTENAASSTVDGFETEVTASLTDAFEIAGTFTYLDARFDELLTDDPAFPELGVQDLSGNQLPLSSKYSFNLSAIYSVPLKDLGEVTLFGEWNYNDDRYFTIFNLDNAIQDAVSTFNAKARFTSTSERWYAELYGRNLTDKTIITQNFVSSDTFGRPRNGQLMAPRTYGIRVGYNFF